jgi:hypothetical protein
VSTWAACRADVPVTAMPSVVLDYCCASRLLPSCRAHGAASSLTSQHSPRVLSAHTSLAAVRLLSLPSHLQLLTRSLSGCARKPPPCVLSWRSSWQPVRGRSACRTTWTGWTQVSSTRPACWHLSALLVVVAERDVCSVGWHAADGLSCFACLVLQRLRRLSRQGRQPRLSSCARPSAGRSSASCALCGSRGLL